VCNKGKPSEDVKIVAGENAEWLVTLQNHSGRRALGVKINTVVNKLRNLLSSLDVLVSVKPI